MSELNGDLLVADEKIEQGLKWSDTMKIPVAGEKLEFGFGLLDESTRQRVQNTLPIQEFKKYKQDGMSEEQERLMELQRKDELTDEEQEELIELIEEVNPEDEARDKLSDEAIEMLMEAGKVALQPTEEDVQDLLSADPDVQRRIFGGELPSHLDRETARDALKDYMEERVDDQPFPIKFSIGQRAYMETMSVLGNGFQST